MAHIIETFPFVADEDLFDYYPSDIDDDPSQ